MKSKESDIRSAAGILALQSFPGVGPKTALKAVLGSSWSSSGTGPSEDSRLIDALDRARGQIVRYEEAGVSTLSFFDQGYPDRLREIPDPPPVLFARGNVELLAYPKLIAVVGTREPTSFGISAASTLTQALGKAGWGIVSGLAKGIDTIGHQAALEVGAPTIAVMGGGLDRIYPAENKGLAEEILSAGGLLISEQPFEAPPRPANLIARDRLQSGLASAVLIAQCGVKSGTLHTARYAACQGRPIFSPVPNSQTPASEGIRLLLERPAGELCSLLPAWQKSRSLCERLGTEPLAHPIESTRLEVFLNSVAAVDQWPGRATEQLTMAS